MIPLLLYIASCFVTLHIITRHLFPRDLALRFELSTQPDILVLIVLLNPVIWAIAGVVWTGNAVLVAVRRAKRYTNRGR